MPTPTTQKYYPSLSTVVSLDDFPDALGFIKDGIQQIFDKVYIKDFQASISPRGESGFYGLSIVSKERLQFRIPGTEMFLILNPDNTDSSISSFPVTVEYQWLILSYLRSFNLQNFSYSPREFFELGLQILNVSEEDIVTLIINNFVSPKSDNLTKVEQFVNDINSKFELTIPVPTSDNKPRELVLAIKNQFTDEASIAAFLLYLLDESSVSNSIENVKNFFKNLIPDDIDSYIKNIITPKARVTLELSAAIEFPRKVLMPWTENANGVLIRDEDETKLAKFKFAKALLYADTQAGIGYNLELAGTLDPKFCEIGKSGMLIQMDSLKLDLSKKTNIPEADADGRPNDFVGVYARALSVTLPSRWFHDDKTQGTPASTLRIGGYDLLIGTGGVSGTFMLETIPSSITGGAVDYYDDLFDIHFPVLLFQTNPETSVVEQVKVLDLDELKSKLFPDSTTSIPPYSFAFPLTLTEKAPLTGGTKTFTTAAAYQTYLKSLPNNNSNDTIPTLWKTIGSEDKGFKVGFNKFDITFKQNKVISSNIKGALEIKKFKQGDNPLLVDIEGHLYDDGDFNLTASFPETSKPEATLFDFVNFKFNSLELGKEDDDYYIGTACEVKFTNEIMKKFMGDQSIIIEKLRIYSDGNIELEGGSIPIPLNISLNLGPVKMAVSNVNFGSTQINGRKYNFWGFDGAISINPLGLDARGEGVKYYYCTEDGHNDSFLRIQTIEVDLMIPGTATEASAMAIIHGMISLPEPGKSSEFMGEVSLKLPKAKISGGVALRFMPKYPAFLVDAHIELPTPIPLGFISISAFRGLLGFRYVATKQAVGLTTDNSWYEFYKYPKPGINIKKFSGPPDSMKYKAPFSIGAGATFGTTADGGHVLSLRAMLLLSLPTLFYIEAGLNVIAGRLGLIENDPSNPPFFAMVAFGDNSLELAAGADFSIPKDSGQIFQLHALLESGFFFKNQKPWYVNLGSRKDPITARILTLFTAKAFIMLSAQGIEAGARLDFKLQQSFGPAKVKLWAYLELGGKISFKRPQMGGYISAGGGIQIKIWIIRVEIVLDTIFSVESFKPFLIYAKLQLSVRVKIGFIKVRKKFKIELQWDINRVVDRTPYSPIPMGTDGDGQDNRTTEAVKGVHMLTNEGFALDYFKTIPNGNAITKVIPLDTYIDIKMAKGLLPDPNLSKKIGGYTGDAKNYTEMMPPVSTQAGRKLRQVKHQYSIKSIGLQSWNSTTTSWEAYHPFEAVVDSDSRDLVKDLPWAQWQKVIDQYDSIRVLATNPFSFLSAGEPGWHVPEQFGITPSKLFCVSEGIEKEHTDFLNKQIGQRYYVTTQYEADKINGLFFKLIGDASEIIENNKTVEGDFMSITGEGNPLGYNRSLSFKNYNELEIIFPESAIEPTLNLTTQAKEVTIKAYTAVIEEGAKLVSYKLVKISKTAITANTADPVVSNELTYTKAELATAITLYNEEIDPINKTKIDKIVITPVSANAERIKAIRNEIAALFDDTYINGNADENGNFSLGDPNDLAKYELLQTELEQLKTDAGNSNPAVSSGPLTFTHYYGYNGRVLYDFDKVLKYNDTYLISFHPQVNTTALVQIDSNGNIIRERLLNGVVTSMQVVNGNLLLTQAIDANECKGIGKAVIDIDFIVGCQLPTAATAIIELDDELNRIAGIKYLNTYSLGFNKLLPLADNELLWINTLENETQINWINGTDRAVIQRVKINETVIKVLKHNPLEFSLVTKDKKIIGFSINTTNKAIVVTDTKLIADPSIAEITDAVIANGKVLVSVKTTDEKFGLAQINGTNITIAKNDIIFDSAIYFSNNTLADNSVITFNKKHLFLFNDSLELTRLIDRGNTAENASVLDVQNEPSLNEIGMLSCKPNEKGVYFSLFNDQFDNCSLNPAANPLVALTTTALTSPATSFTVLSNVTNSDYIKGTEFSNLLTIKNVICSKGGNTADDPELDYTTYIQKVEWLSKESYFHNTTIPDSAAVIADIKAMEAAVQNTVQPIWRPNSTYCLNFTLTDRVDDKDKEFKYYYGFKTLGPVGHYPVPDPVVPADQIAPAKNELTELAKSPLTSLRQYLDYNRSYPNADGSLLQSKPSFYGNEQCKVSLFFTSPYVYHMFKDWLQYESRPKITGTMNLIIKDPLTDALIPYPLPVETTITYPKAEDKHAEWVDDNDPRLPVGIQLLNNLINANPVLKSGCTLQIGEALQPKSYGFTVSLTDLKPSKLYTILVNNFFDDTQNGTSSYSENVLVHQFGFQTSRYRDFAEQVLSYEIKEKDESGVVLNTHKALFDIKLSLSEDQVTALNKVILGQSDPLSDAIALRYQHSFDRAIEGILKLSPLDPAQCTEVNRIINTNTGDVVALLIRNPEPFNIPKIPLDEIKNTIVVVNALGDQNPEYKTLHSKDYSQVLLMPDSKKITDNDLDVMFEYRMWNNDVGTTQTISVDKQILPIDLELANINL